MDIIGTVEQCSLAVVWRVTIPEGAHLMIMTANLWFCYKSAMAVGGINWFWQHCARGCRRFSKVPHALLPASRSR